MEEFIEFIVRIIISLFLGGISTAFIVYAATFIFEDFGEMKTEGLLMVFIICSLLGYFIINIEEQDCDPYYSDCDY